MQTPSIEIICPLYNAEKYLFNLHCSLEIQTGVNIKNIRYLITESTDRTVTLVKTLRHCTYEIIKKSDFSHSLTREKAALESTADIIVFITQDVVIKRDDWLKNLVTPLITGEADATFSRQICDNNSIEKYTRELNYPATSRVVSKADVEKLGLRTFFSSDASAAIRTDVFRALNGYDHKNLPISEDMYFSYKLIMAGGKIKYCANSEVHHSHSFSLREQFSRYCETGKFFKQNPYLDNYQTTKTGGNMAKYVLKRALKDKNWRALVQYTPNMAARYLGMRKGKR